MSADTGTRKKHTTAPVMGVVSGWCSVGALVVLTRPIFHHTGVIRTGRVGLVVGFSARGSTNVVFSEHLICCHGEELEVVEKKFE